MPATDFAGLLASLPVERRPRVRAVLVAALAGGVAALTLGLAWLGDPASHASVLYLLPVTAAALLLGTRWAWATLGASVLGYASLFVVTDAGHAVHHDESHILTMWLATVAVAGFVATAMGHLASSLRRREQERRALEARAARDARLVALSALAAGAAHELGSPLGTIAVAARELERSARAGGDPGSLAEDARLIRQQTERCREILTEMGAAAGVAVGAAPEPCSGKEIVELALAVVDPGLRAGVSVRVDDPMPTLRLPRAAVARALANLLQNALEASRPDPRAEVRVHALAGALRLAVRDHGVGMEPEVLARAGEPFFSTRPAGHGQGLGLFLAREVAERLGGGLQLESVPGGGTTAALELRDVDLPERTA